MLGGCTIETPIDKRNGQPSMAPAALEAVGLQPVALGGQGLAAKTERPERRAVDRRQIGQPAAVRRGFDVAGPGDGGAAQCGKVDAPRCRCTGQPRRAR